MKKFITIIMLLIPVGIMAEPIWYTATSLAVKIENRDWSNWEDCKVHIVIDTDKDILTIYSKDKQEYRILDVLDSPYDPSGDQIAFRVVDQDSDLGTLRFRRERNGNRQIYIDFRNISWVYNIE